MGEKRGFRAYFQAVEQRSRQRIHDDRCHHRPCSSTQRRCAKKNGPQAIGRSRGGLTTKSTAVGPFERACPIRIPVGSPRKSAAIIPPINETLTSGLL